jgi:hypothetical protein
MISQAGHVYGRSAANSIQWVRKSGIEGARALLETFYYAFNNRDSDVFAKI